MQKTLRPYQQNCLNTLRKRLKEVTHPLLVDASVGSGKSLILSELLLIMERAGYRALCLTMNSTLIQQNADTYQSQNGNPGIYCAGLNSKDTKQLVIFGSPHSVVQGIRNKDEISRQPFNLIVVDECHNISPHDFSSMYMRILHHYGRMAQQEQYSFRVVGLTGTPYRGKGISIVGPDEYFKERVCQISTSWLIEKGFLTKPYFGITNTKLDFSDIKINNMGQFNGKELQAIVDKSKRLTAEIMMELATIDCTGIFIFASTKKHCEECLRGLPYGTAAIITGDTPHHERKRILESARQGATKYLISVGCLVVGVDIPLFDTCAWLRPTESLVLYTQGIGRVLRLHPNKSRATVLDYSGNLDRHGDIDDPIINEALQPKEPNDPEYCIPCWTCSTLNTVHSRRCIGIVGDSRCSHYFEFKECSCGTQNDITSRECRICGKELIDPNAKLNRYTRSTKELTVLEAVYEASMLGHTYAPIIKIKYVCSGGITVYENYLTNTERARQITYNKFIKLHCEKPSEHYRHMMNVYAMKAMLNEPTLKTPYKLICSVTEYNRLTVSKKMFHERVTQETGWKPAS